MSIFSKIASSAMAAVVIGAGAVYAAGECSNVLAQAKELVTDTAAYFIIKEYDGKVALFREGADEPAAVYTTPVEQINPADAYLLREGIRLRGMAEVSRLLEDLDIE